MKYNEFVKELKQLGVIFDERKRPTKLYLNGKQSTLKRHPTQEISNAYAKFIRSQLGLK